MKVVFRKKVVDRTNEEGEFSLAVTDEVDRLTVTFQDPADQFSETTQTMPFQRGRTVFHRIVLQKEDPPVIFDSSKDLRVPLGHAGDNMAELELPADNLLDKDGKPFKGDFSSLGVCEKAVKKLCFLVTVSAHNCPYAVFVCLFLLSFALFYISNSLQFSLVC